MAAAARRAAAGASSLEAWGGLNRARSSLMETAWKLLGMLEIHVGSG